LYSSLTIGRDNSNSLKDTCKNLISFEILDFKFISTVIVFQARFVRLVFEKSLIVPELTTIQDEFNTLYLADDTILDPLAKLKLPVEF